MAQEQGFAPVFNANQTVTMQIRATNANKVQIIPLGQPNGMYKAPLDLTKGSNGIWNVTFTPDRPGSITTTFRSMA
jgi:hypothetical protein